MSQASSILANQSDTIFALSTPPGKSAVAVVRVSGPAVEEILLKMWPGTKFEDRVATLVMLYDDQQRIRERVVVIRFFAPRSFTAEDLVEFQLTGSKPLVQGVLDRLSTFAGCRPAEPGEFARRAFVNGKLDLVNVEGLAAVINAETQVQLRYASMMAGGAVSSECEKVRGLLIKALALVEGGLDFSDAEDAAEMSLTDAMRAANEARRIMLGLLAAGIAMERQKNGLVVAIIGAPNTGKSTLINRVAGRELAITSALPGTTRDPIELEAVIAGHNVLFVDTAGLRDSEDPIEAEGVRRARQRGEFADFVIWLSDDTWDDRLVSGFRGRIQKVRSKIDFECSGGTLPDDVMPISGRTGLGLPALMSRILECADNRSESGMTICVGTPRQAASLREAIAALGNVDLWEACAPELVAEDLRHAVTALGRITGVVQSEDVLKEVFSTLCVGK